VTKLNLLADIEHKPYNTPKGSSMSLFTLVSIAQFSNPKETFWVTIPWKD
jgi:hypothetical protein